MKRIFKDTRHMEKTLGGVVVTAWVADSEPREELPPLILLQRYEGLERKVGLPDITALHGTSSEAQVIREAIRRLDAYQFEEKP